MVTGGKANKKRAKIQHLSYDGHNVKERRGWGNMKYAYVRACVVVLVQLIFKWEIRNGLQRKLHFNKDLTEVRGQIIRLSGMNTGINNTWQKEHCVSFYFFFLSFICLHNRLAIQATCFLMEIYLIIFTQSTFSTFVMTGNLCLPFIGRF